MKILEFLKIVIKKQGVVFSYYKLNPFNPLSYIVALIMLLILMLMFLICIPGLGLRKSFNAFKKSLGNPFTFK